MNEINIFDTSGSFEIADYYFAKQAFNQWQAEQAQDIEDYLIRQRKAELNALVKRVIENELSENNRLLIELRWNKGYSLEKIAEILCVDASTVHRRLEKITDELYEKLKYALEYRFGKEKKAARVLIKSEIKNSQIVRQMSDCGTRIRALRNESHISLSELSRCTKTDEKRLKQIESGKAEVDITELIRLSSFFKVSTDYLLFGKSRVLRDPLTGLPINCRC